MQGVPDHPVSCVQCGSERGCAKDRLCHGCRVASVARRRRRHVWTTILDQQLRRTYQLAHSRAVLVTGISSLQRLTQFPRSVIVSRAAALGLNRPGRRWSQEETLRLREIAGSRSISEIASEFGRSYYSVKGALARLHVAGRVTEGYSRQDLEQLLGVSSRQVRRWIAQRWIKPVNDRIPESEVGRFLRRHPEQYQLNRVDEAWFKGLMFPAFNSVRATDVQTHEPMRWLNEIADSRVRESATAFEFASNG